MREELGFAYCGLCCATCSENADCVGCSKRGCKDVEWCHNFACCSEKKLDGCYACPDFPCTSATNQKFNMLTKPKIRLFSEFIKEYGKEKFLSCLKTNESAGILYHYPDGIIGEYDNYTERETLFDFIMHAPEYINQPYKRFPYYETANFRLRMVQMSDAEDLLTCYSDEKAWPIFNSDNCTSDFHFTTKEAIEEAIGYWRYAYSIGCYLRFSILDCSSMHAIGTIEIFNFGDQKEIKNTGILRLDLASAYETEENILQLLTVMLNESAPQLGIEHLITKAVPEAVQRIAALTKLSFASYDHPEVLPFSDYYCKTF